MISSSSGLLFKKIASSSSAEKVCAGKNIGAENKVKIIKFQLCFRKIYLETFSTTTNTNLSLERNFLKEIIIDELESLFSKEKSC